jgi:cathepsin L
VGGWTGYAFKYIAEHGVVYEATYPYHNVQQPTCGRTTAGHRANSTKTFTIRSYIRIGKSCNQVISALVDRPLAVAVNADGWQYYSEGIFNECEPGQVNHGVTLAGVNKDSWLVKNSWGYAWGEQGYMRIGREADNEACGICKYASYVNI